MQRYAKRITNRITNVNTKISHNISYGLFWQEGINNAAHSFHERYSLQQNGVFLEFELL